MPRTTELSVVVPTYDEVDNIRPLTERLFAATKKAALTADLLIMDDESKGTPQTEKIVAELQKEGYAVKIHVRRKGEGRGLSSAVLLGFEKAKYSTVMCMDADLQHEPESVPAVADPVLNGDADFSVGSRNVDGGEVAGWTLTRKIISKGATLLALPLTTCTDPMSGFFCIPKKTLAVGHAKCNPVGFKIGLELMVRCRCKKVVDVPITFRDRVAGESKLSMKQNVLYLQQLVALYLDMYLVPIVLLVLLALYVLYYIAKEVLGLL